MLRKLLFISILTGNVCLAQDSHFSQFWANPLHLNPALAGNTMADVRVISNYRTQWKAVAEPYNTIGASVDFTLPGSSRSKDFWGMGVNFISDKGGLATYKTTNANFSLSYNKLLGGSKTNIFSVGALAGYAQRAWDSPSLSWDSQWNGVNYDPSLPSNESAQILPSLSYLDVGVGVAWNYQFSKHVRMLSGASMAHFNRSDLSFTKAQKDPQKIKTTVHATMQIMSKKKSNLSFIPSVMYVQQGPQSMVNFGGGGRFRFQDRARYTGYESEVAMYLGLYYRWKDATYAVVKIDYADFAVGVSYDVNVSKLNVASNGRGGLELNLIYSKVLYGNSKSNPKAGMRFVQL
jgi:type IX secretion system PorP/SprF family membrane protein